MSRIPINPGVFDRAAERIERDGFQKHAYYKGWDEESGMSWPDAIGAEIRSGSLPCCALGAIYAESYTIISTSYNDRADAHANFFAQAIGIGSGAWEVPDWNDQTNQRKARVVRALRRAAEVARQREEGL